MAISAKVAANRKRVAEKAERMMKGEEITLGESTYKIDLLNALNYYNISHDDKTKKKWLLKHLSKEDKNLAKQLEVVDEVYFRYAGILARLMDTGSVLRENELNHYQSRVDIIKQKAKELAAVVPEKKVEQKVVSIQDRMLELARIHAAEFDAAIDEFVTTGKTTFSAKGYLAANQVTSPVAKKISEMYTPLIGELRSAIDGDPDLVEGYANFTNRGLKKYLDFVEGMVADCAQQVQTAKARKPRAKKSVPPSKVVARVKYMKEFKDGSLHLVSINPTKILESTEVWVYNTKYRVVSVYRAEVGTLGVKGTSIIGFDTSTSVSQKVRNPEVFFSDKKMGKRVITAALKALKTKAGKATGRLNADTVIVAAF